MGKIKPRWPMQNGSKIFICVLKKKMIWKLEIEFEGPYQSFIETLEIYTYTPRYIIGFCSYCRFSLLISVALDPVHPLPETHDLGSPHCCPRTIIFFVYAEGSIKFYVANVFYPFVTDVQTISISPSVLFQERFLLLPFSCKFLDSEFSRFWIFLHFVVNNPLQFIKSYP